MSQRRQGNSFRFSNWNGKNSCGIKNGILLQEALLGFSILLLVISLLFGICTLLKGVYGSIEEEMRYE